MDETQNLGETYLAHYIDQVYDPKAAHEYYLRTRELKGYGDSKSEDSSTPRNKKDKPLSKDAKKKAEKEASDALKREKAGQIKLLTEQQKEELGRLKNNAQERQNKVREALTTLMEKLKADRQQKLEEINAEKAAKVNEILIKRTSDLAEIALNAEIALSRLPPMPKTSSANAIETRLRLVAKIKGDAKTSSEQIINGSKTEIDKIKNDTDASILEFDQKNKELNSSSKTQNEEVGVQLKDSVGKAQKKYQTLRESLMSKYATQN